MSAVSEVASLLESQVDALFADVIDQKLLRAAEAGEWAEGLWNSCEELGLLAALVPEDQGGAGLALPEVCGVWRSLGRSSVPIPLGETMIAAGLAGTAGLEPGEGPIGLAVEQRVTLDAAGRLSGRVSAVPWGRNARQLLVVADTAAGARLCLVPTTGLDVQASVNIGREPRDSFLLDGVLPGSVSEGEAPPYALHIAAALRTAQIAGALDAALHLTIDHANTRVQFGRALGKFQSVQQALASLAAEAAAANIAASIACDVLDRSADPELLVAAAKVRAGEAASNGPKVAHQLHGAIGFTDEYQLHFLTRRLWSWRAEFGSERFWARRLGDRAFAAGPSGLWPSVTAA